MRADVNDKQSRAEAEKHELRRLNELEDLKAVASLPAGRRFLHRLIFEVAGAESLSYTGSGADTYFREGRRDVGLTVMTELQDHVTEQYVRMIAEKLAAYQEQKNREKMKQTQNPTNED